MALRRKERCNRDREQENTKNHTNRGLSLHNLLRYRSVWPQTTAQRGFN